MHIIPGFLIRQVAGETIAVPTGDAAHCLSGLVALNDSGVFLFELLQTEQTEASLLRAFTDAYDVEDTVAEADIADFLALLRKHRMLVETPVQI